MKDNERSHASLFEFDMKFAPLIISLVTPFSVIFADDRLGPPPWTKEGANSDDRPPPWMQETPGGNKFGVDPMELLQTTEIKKQLKLTDEQCQKLAELADQYKREIQKEVGNVALDKLTEEERAKKEAELRVAVTKLMESEREEVEKILTPDQLDAFQRIMLKVNGAETMFVPKQQEDLAQGFSPIRANLKYRS